MTFTRRCLPSILVISMSIGALLPAALGQGWGGHGPFGGRSLERDVLRGLPPLQRAQFLVASREIAREVRQARLEGMTIADPVVQQQRQELIAQRAAEERDALLQQAIRQVSRSRSSTQTRTSNSTNARTGTSSSAGSSSTMDTTIRDLPLEARLQLRTLNRQLDQELRAAAREIRQNMTDPIAQQQQLDQLQERAVQQREAILRQVGVTVPVVMPDLYSHRSLNPHMAGDAAY